MSGSPEVGSSLVAEVKTNPAWPESASVTVTVAVTVSSLWLGGQRLSGLTVQAIVGGVLSMLIPPTVPGSATFPALSVQVPVFVTDWFAPSVLTVLPATVFTSRPDWTLPTSAQLKLTVTSVLFQPLALGAGVRAPAMTGFVLSILTV